MYEFLHLRPQLTIWPHLNPNRNTMSKVTSFKRLEIGTTFVSQTGESNGCKFRKVSKDGAFRLKESGRGETNAKVPFTRSHACTPC